MAKMKSDQTWIELWDPEDTDFWELRGRAIAWRTLWITTVALTLSFATWFMMSAMVVKLPGIGFTFDHSELFWLAAMPGLAGGTLRILHTFLLPIYGTRHVITISTLGKLIPCIGIGLAVMNPATPFWVFMMLAFTVGLGGGDFSSYMPSTNLFFPRRLKGTALGIQAGFGNLGVSLAQFMTPVMLGFATYGGPQLFTQFNSKTKQVLGTAPIHLQSAAFWYVPFLLLMTVVCWWFIRSVPVRGTFREQLDIFKEKHTWYCTVIYLMTFGTFSGLSAAFPMMIKSLYGGFPDAPDPLRYAFYGPLIGSLSRVGFGFVADKIGGAVLTTVTGVGIAVCAIAMVLLGLVAPNSTDTFSSFVIVMFATFFFTGMGNASTFRQFPIIFSHNARQGAGVIGWTAAIAAYGPFIFSILVGQAIGRTGNANVFYAGLAVFTMIATSINWWFYNRKGCERPC